MIINIKNPPKKIDTGKSVITDELVAKEYTALKDKPYLTAKETMRLHRIEKYGDKAVAKHKMSVFKNKPSYTKTLDKMDDYGVEQKEERVKDVIEDIYRGVNVIEACENHMVEPKYFFKIIEKPEYQEDKINFLNARITQAEYYLYRREKLEKDLLAGRIDTATYSALSSDYKYLAAKLAPLAYGDKIQFEANVNKVNTYELINSDKVKELNNLITSNIIDAEFTEE